MLNILTDFCGTTGGDGTRVTGLATAVQLALPLDGTDVVFPLEPFVVAAVVDVAVVDSRDFGGLEGRVVAGTDVVVAVTATGTCGLGMATGGDCIDADGGGGGGGTGGGDAFDSRTWGLAVPLTTSDNLLSKTSPAVDELAAPGPGNGGNELISRSNCGSLGNLLSLGRAWEELGRIFLAPSSSLLLRLL